MSTDKRTWQQLAELAANEKDPDKLRALIRELTEALDQQAKDTPRPTLQHLSKRLLFVDDEEGIRETLPLLLKARGFDVRVAASVAEALSQIRTHKFDVLLSDLNIGKDGDGFTVVQAMRRAHPNCVTVLLTGYPAFESALKAIRDDVDDYFVKPAELDSLGIINVSVITGVLNDPGQPEAKKNSSTTLPPNRSRNR